MYIALSLVGVLFLTAQCCSRAVPQNDRQYPVQILYQRQERPVPRASEQYQYQYEAEPERTYPQESQYEPNYSERPLNQIETRPRPTKSVPFVEQYLKEVTPTTKTTYDPKTNKKTVVENKRVLYTYRAETQQQPLDQQEQLVEEEQPKPAPIPQNVLAYQNALIAQQNAIYEQQRADQLKKQIQQQQQRQYYSEDTVPHSQIYVSQNIQKEPTATPVESKPKQTSVDDEVKYYSKVQYEQEHIRKHNGGIEAKEAAPLKYQVRVPENSKTDEDGEEVYGFLYQSEPNGPIKIIKPPVPQREEVYKVVYQPAPEQESAKYYGEPEYIQYQVESAYPDKPVQQLTQEGPQKYRGNIVKYQSVKANKGAAQQQAPASQYVQEQPQRYQSQKYPEPSQAQPQPQPQQRPAYLGPSDEEYRQSQFKQSLGRNSSLRVLKTGKPVVFIGHEE